MKKHSPGSVANSWEIQMTGLPLRSGSICIIDDEGAIEFEVKAPSEISKQLRQYLVLSQAKEYM
jgi:hypothetical protein